MLRHKKIALGLFASLCTGVLAVQATSPVSATPPTVVGWQAVGNGLSGTGANPRVFQLVKDTAGNLYAGGSFTGGLSKWTGSGDWATLGNGVGGGSYPWVYALGLDESATPDELYVGGAFTKVNGTAIDSPMLAKVTTDTGTWTAIPGVSSTSVNAYDGVEEIAVVSSSAVYFGGGKITTSTPNSSPIAKWNGSAFSALSAGLNTASLLSSLVAFGDKIYAGGQFTQASNPGPVSVGRVAQYDADIVSPNFNKWSALGGGDYGPSNGNVAAIAVKDSNNIFIGGTFWSVNNAGLSLPMQGLAKWDGTQWVYLGGTPIYSVVEELRVIGDYLYVGGEFQRIGNISANNIARYNLVTETWETLVQGCENGVNGVVRSIIPTGDADGSIYVGGGFTNAGGVATADLVAKFTPGSSTLCDLPLPPAPWFQIGYVADNIRFGTPSKNGQYIWLVWGQSPTFPISQYIVSLEEQLRDSKGNKTGTRPLPEYDCVTAAVECVIKLPYFSSGGPGLGNTIFRLTGRTIYGTTQTLTIEAGATRAQPTDGKPNWASAPRNVKVSSGWDSITVSFDPPERAASDDYESRYIYAVSGVYKDAAGRSRELLGLTTSTSYTFGSLKSRRVPAGASITVVVNQGWVRGGEYSAPSAPAKAKSLTVTASSRSKVFFLFGGGSDLSVTAAAPGYAANTQITPWVKIGNGEWTKGSAIGVDGSGQVAFKRRLPRNQNGSTVRVKFQDPDGNFSEEVSLGSPR